MAGMSPAPARARRLVVAAVLAVLGTVVPALPAAADPPGPTDYRSEVASIEPAVDGVDVSVVGGDGFLLLEVDEGHEVEVPGYSGEPYLRVAADGTVEENVSSAASHLNQARQRTDLGRGFDPDAEPRWEVRARDGRWAWHDHRIHRMGSTVPPAAETAEGVRWEVPLVVDGTDVVVHGSYRLVGSSAPVLVQLLPWAVLAAAVAAAVALGLARLLPAVTVAGAAVLAGGVAGVAVGMAQRGVDPPGAPTSPLVVVLPAIAAVAGLITVIQRGRVLRAVAALAGAAAAGGWAVVRLPVLWHAVLPTSLPSGVDRAVTAAALGVAAGAAVLVVRSGALATAPRPQGPPAATEGAPD